METLIARKNGEREREIEAERNFELAILAEHLSLSLSLSPSFSPSFSLFLPLQHIRPHDHERLSQAELLVIDEAAAIPLTIVKKLLGPFLVLMSSTVNGYVCVFR